MEERVVLDAGRRAGRGGVVLAGAAVGRVARVGVDEAGALAADGEAGAVVWSLEGSGT